MKKSVALLALGLVTWSCRSNSVNTVPPPLLPSGHLEEPPPAADDVAHTPAPTTAAERASRRLDTQLVALIRELYPDTGLPQEQEQRDHHFYAVRKIATAPPGAPRVDAVEVSRRPSGGGPLVNEVLFLDGAGAVLTRAQVATPVSEHVLRIWGTQVDLGNAEHMLRLRDGYPEPLAVSAALQYAGAVVVSRLQHVNEGESWESWNLPEDVGDGLRLIAIETEGDGGAAQLPDLPISYRVLPPRITDLTPTTGAIESSLGRMPWEGAVRVQVLSEDGAELGVLRILAEGRMP